MRPTSGGFDYGPNNNLSTETLTIAPYTLNGLDIDRIIVAVKLWIKESVEVGIKYIYSCIQ